MILLCIMTTEELTEMYKASNKPKKKTNWTERFNKDYIRWNDGEAGKMNNAQRTIMRAYHDETKGKSNYIKAYKRETKTRK